MRSCRKSHHQTGADGRRAVLRRRAASGAGPGPLLLRSRWCASPSSCCFVRPASWSGWRVSACIPCSMSRASSRPSWWRAAAFSVLGWIGLFIAIMGAIESVRHLGEDAMVFLLPFMLYPIALAVSGVVRREAGSQERRKKRSHDAEASSSPMCAGCSSSCRSR